MRSPTVSVYATIDDLRSQLGGLRPERSPEYIAKMLHPLPPDVKEVNREAFILSHCKGKRVLEFGATGPLHDAIVQVASEYLGIDREDGPNGVVGYDLDDCAMGRMGQRLGCTEDDVRALSFKPEIIICGEVIEHLGNPQWFLKRLKEQHAGVPVLITVPNAFSAAAAHWIAKGIENVNADHVAWYSPKTLSVLLQRAGYAVGGLFWYGGSGPTAEGLIVVTE